jgi:hypothetical protein
MLFAGAASRMKARRTLDAAHARSLDRPPGASPASIRDRGRAEAALALWKGLYAHVFGVAFVPATAAAEGAAAP